MPDIDLIWSPALGGADFALAGADLASGHDLVTAILISLFTDRRADPDDVIPDGTTDPRGWWGDLGADRPIGSKIWLLERAKATEAVRLQAQGYISDALQWLVDDGVAASVDVETVWNRPNFLAARIVVVEPDGRATPFNYEWAWGAVS